MNAVEDALRYCLMYDPKTGLERCGVEAPDRFGGHNHYTPWKCSRKPGHIGDHVAIDNDGSTVRAQWGNTERPPFSYEVEQEKLRNLPAHCDACRDIEEDARRRIELRRRMEDVAAAFAMIGFLSFLRQYVGPSFRTLDDGTQVPREPTEVDIEWAIHYLQVGLNRMRFG